MQDGKIDCLGLDILFGLASLSVALETGVAKSTRIAALSITLLELLNILLL